MKKGCSILFIVFIIILATLGFLVNSFLKSGCGNKKYLEIYSPNKEQKAVVFEYDCGATTDFATHISILDGDEILEKKDSGNLFIADSNHGEANMNGEIIDIKVNWKNNNTLIIDYDKRARIFKNKPSKSGVNIIYKSH